MNTAGKTITSQRSPADFEVLDSLVGARAKANQDLIVELIELYLEDTRHAHFLSAGGW